MKTCGKVLIRSVQRTSRNSSRRGEIGPLMVVPTPFAPNWNSAERLYDGMVRFHHAPLASLSIPIAKGLLSSIHTHVNDLNIYVRQ